MIFDNLLLIAYFIGSVTFILGLKMLSKPESARKGNLVAAFGMTISILATIFLYQYKTIDENGVEQSHHLGNLLWIFGGIAIGSVLGTVSARKVKMTAMPQMVSIFNGMGGACAAIISIVEMNHYIHNHPDSLLMNLNVLTILLGMIIGSVSFSGSMIAFGKLDGKIKDRSLPGQKFITVGLLLGLLATAVVFMLQNTDNALPVMFVLLGFAALYGILFVMPIGGADMPVVISLLNSFTGVAAACGGFLYHNPVMLTGGILVGAAGTLLTILMCNAMNRSLANVIFGAFGGNSGAAGAITGADGGIIKEVTVSDAAINMSYSKKVIIVPGYGLAVAQAQHICHELEELLEEKGVEVKYAIHPVAGRMPGHMNVLLAEADVSYDKLLEMDDANSEFPTTDIVLILGANDVVNPAAKNNPSSPIYGMPILEVEKAKNIIVNKRSMNKGYAGIENELFFSPKTQMLFGDAKSVIQKLVSEVKAN